MDYTKLNEVLKDLNGFRYNNKKNIITENVVNSDDEGGWESYEIYPFDGDVLIKLKIVANSYGTEQFVDGIEFVMATEKTISTYEAI